MRYALDTGVLGKICHPRRYEESRVWLRRELHAGHDLYLPEIVDFELRRELLRMGAVASLRRLDELALDIVYLSLNTNTMRAAATLWADLWRTGQPVGSAEALGADAIIAAQARQVGATVVTTNGKHLARMVDVLVWETITAP